MFSSESSTGGESLRKDAIILSRSALPELVFPLGFQSTLSKLVLLLGVLLYGILRRGSTHRHKDDNFALDSNTT